MKFLKLNKQKKERIIEIDFARGVLIWFMIIDHLFFDFWAILPQFFSPTSIEATRMINGLYSFGSWYWDWPLRIGFRFAVLAMFFLISGISSYFSKNNLKRGLIILAVGIVISLGFFTYGKISGSGDYVFFGAITCFGVSILIYWLFRFIFSKLFPKYLDDFKYIALGLGIIIVVIGLLFDCWNIKNLGPQSAGRLGWDNFMYIILGYRQDTFATDWLPLFPYLGFLFIGSFIGEIFYKERKSYFNKLPARPSKDENSIIKARYYGLVVPYKVFKSTIAFSGHYSIFFYILHQVFLILILGIIMLAMGCKLVL